MSTAGSSGGTGVGSRIAPISWISKVASDAAKYSEVSAFRSKGRLLRLHPAGRMRAYRIVDPSAHNWQGLAWALRGEQISNFPICNKSFNLSYCGTDR